MEFHDLRPSVVFVLKVVPYRQGRCRSHPRCQISWPSCSSFFGTTKLFIVSMPFLPTGACWGGVVGAMLVPETATVDGHDADAAVLLRATS